MLILVGTGQDKVKSIFSFVLKFKTHSLICLSRYVTRLYFKLHNVFQEWNSSDRPNVCGQGV